MSVRPPPTAVKHFPLRFPPGANQTVSGCHSRAPAGINLAVSPKTARACRTDWTRPHVHRCYPGLKRSRGPGIGFAVAYRRDNLAWALVGLLGFVGLVVVACLPDQKGKRLRRIRALLDEERPRRRTLPPAGG
jgi:hypothetical protein